MPSPPDGEPSNCAPFGAVHLTRRSRVLRVRLGHDRDHLAALLESLALTGGTPEYIRSANGDEFIAREAGAWLEQSGCQTIFITPGSPWESPCIEGFSAEFRDECLDCEVFASLAEARIIIEAWRDEYNTERPHNSLGHLTPDEFARRSAEG